MLPCCWRSPVLRRRHRNGICLCRCAEPRAAFPSHGVGGRRCQLRAETGTEAIYAPAAALLHLLGSALIMKRESSVGRWAFFNKITKAAFSPKQESKVFAAVSQHRDAFGMGGNAPTHSSHRSHGRLPRGRSGSRCFPSCLASTLCWCFSRSWERSFPWHETWQGLLAASRASSSEPCL